MNNARTLLSSMYADQQRGLTCRCDNAIRLQLDKRATHTRTINPQIQAKHQQTNNKTATPLMGFPSGVANNVAPVRTGGGGGRLEEG